jgi:hypothetical protein
MSDFLPIPGHPGYSVSAKGEVQTETGWLLCHDAKGRVSLRIGRGQRRLLYVGDLLEQAGFFQSGAGKEALARAEEVAADAFRRLNLAEAEIDNLRDSLDKARRANELLIGLRDTLTRRIEALEKGGEKPSAPKRGRPARVELEMEPPEDFSESFPEEDW